MHRFKNLKVWQNSMDLAESIYKMTAEFPSQEKFGLVSQINRCAVSICSNIAEGAGRGSDKEFINFLSIALGSAFELETQVTLSLRFKYISESDFNQIVSLIEEIQKMIIGLQNKLRNEYSKV